MLACSIYTCCTLLDAKPKSTVITEETAEDSEFETDSFVAVKPVQRGGGRRGRGGGGGTEEPVQRGGGTDKPAKSDKPAKKGKTQRIDYKTTANDRDGGGGFS